MENQEKVAETNNPQQQKEDLSVVNVILGLLGLTIFTLIIIAMLWAHEKSSMKWCGILSAWACFLLMVIKGIIVNLKVSAEVDSFSIVRDILFAKNDQEYSWETAIKRISNILAWLSLCLMVSSMIITLIIFLGNHLSWH